MIAQLSVHDRAVALLQAKRNVALRLMGDVPGHEFHGNQWTSGDPLAGETHGEHTPAGQRKLMEYLAKETGEKIVAHGSVARGETSKNDFDVAVKEQSDDDAEKAYSDYLDEMSADARKVERGEMSEKEYNDRYYGEPTDKIHEALTKIGFVHENDAQWLGIHVARYHRAGTKHTVEIWRSSGSTRYDLEGLRAESNRPGARLSAVDKPTRFASTPSPDSVGKSLSRFRIVVKRSFKTLAQHPERPIHAAADRHLKPMTLAVRAAFNLGRKAYKSGGVDAAAKAVRSALLKTLPPALLATMKSGGEAALGALRMSRHAELRTLRPKGPRLGIVFNVDDPRAVEWAREHALELADGISETTKEDLRRVIADALDGDGIDAAYDAILEAVGSDARADVIARTEIMAAANEGQREGWQQAQDEGLLPVNTQVTWIATDVGACPECEALDGATRDLNGEYEGDGGEGPPLHPNCRCTEGIA